MSTRATEIDIDLTKMTVTVPIGQGIQMVLIDPRQGKAKVVPIVHHGETIVKSSQGRISKLDFNESELF
ncbi:hypothetical protein BRE01_31100 [Brevibacillus reuszeri]|uniref:Uncharacterized protein n=1 Tax=Brevibacillus reuszeri TaxID=54915 RepID=A0A0K9YYN9_9BACL|nr:XtrA/YqaO family protein [Brevibacillus reuszeri]KNB73752.1 hypothetical protein ADS79_07390 [Brevibacillus reuszeri]MED1858433.1 XtrA/YqaO family protein [Brevibacillus reuszeri]GED69408.1 hypothetical protein BRE01_31100 [Brevibacillus reuszeri]